MAPTSPASRSNSREPMPRLLSATIAPRSHSEPRQRERDVILTDGTTHAGRTPEHWRRVALVVARMTGKRVGMDTATRMAKDADRQG